MPGTLDSMPTDTEPSIYTGPEGSIDPAALAALILEWLGEDEQFDFVDLFSGPGGWDVAAKYGLGWKGVGLEWDAAACNTRRAAGLHTIQGDVRAFGPRDFPARGFIASPPCQTFSAAGKGVGRAALDEVLAAADQLARRETVDYTVFSDERTGLVLEPLRWVLQAIDEGTPYEWVAFEQVPTVLPVWQHYAEILRAEGYSVVTDRLTSEQYGVPQTRKRAILIGRLNAEAKLPAPLYSKYYSRNPSKLDAGLPKWISMAEALGRGLQSRPSPTITAGGTAAGGAEPISHIHRWINSDDWLVTQRRNSGPAAAREPRDVEDAPSYTVRAHGSGSHPSGVEWDVVQRSNYSGSGPRGATAEERGRTIRTPDEPSVTITGRVPQWTLVSPQSVAGVGRAERDADEPSVTVTPNFDRAKFTHMGDVKSPHGCVRPIDAPAPTIMAAHDNGNLRFVEGFAGAGRTAEQTSRQQPRSPDQPAHTVTGAGSAAWRLRNNNTENAAERELEQPAPTLYFGQRSNYVAWEGPEGEELPDWAHNRPSTTIVGSFKPEVVAAPGYRTTVSRQNAPNSVRVTVQEAGILQSFPTDYPWQGSKSKQYEQCGNAVPPLLAYAVLKAASGLDD